MTNYWMVRSDPSIRDDVEEGGFVAIGFGGVEIGNIEGLSDDQIRERVEQRRPTATRNEIGSDTGSLNRFANSIRIGDWVVTGLENRQYLVGTISSNYKYDGSNTEFPH